MYDYPQSRHTTFPLVSFFRRSCLLSQKHACWCPLWSQWAFKTLQCKSNITCPNIKIICKQQMIMLFKHTHVRPFGSWSWKSSFGWGKACPRPTPMSTQSFVLFFSFLHYAGNVDKAFFAVSGMSSFLLLW